MSRTFREAFDQDDVDILIEALEQYKKKCKGYANRELLGYGSAREQEKKERWAKKAEEVDRVLKIVVNETI